MALNERETLKIVNGNFNERLRPIINGANTDYNPLALGRPSQTLLNAGVPDLPIEMSVQRLIDKKLQANHPFRLVSVVHMPEFLSDPIAIFQSKTRLECKVVLTEMESESVNMVVVIEINRPKGSFLINDIRSVYPKDNIVDILRWIVQDGLLEYADKEKVLNWIDKQQSNSAEVTHLIEDAVKVIKKF
jgi:hypothetical protein